MPLGAEPYCLKHAFLPRVSSTTPPPTFVLCVRGERFELGEGLSDAAMVNAERTFDLLKRLCRTHDAALFHAAAHAP